MCRKKSDTLYLATNRIHLALTAFGKNPDFLMLDEQMDLSPYRVVFLPLCERVSPRIIKHWKEYVRNGGCLVAVTRLNLMEESGCYRREPYPCGMTELFGLEIAENRELLNSQTDANMGVFDISSLPKTSVRLSCFRGTANAERYVEEILPLTCTVLEKLSSTCFAGSPLLTRNSYGMGTALYVSAFLDVPGVRKMVRRVLEECGISLPDVELPPEVSRIERGGYLFYINSSSRKVDLEERISGEILLGDANSRETIALNPYEVLIARSSGKSR
ncbi:MAG: beta-galactosidase trimerization domain-containing protein [Victivallales bacterium]